MQENKIAILSTGYLPAQLAREANKYIRTDIIPFIETEAISSIEVQQEIEQALLLRAVVVFTSRHAVEAVAAELQGLDPEWSIYCIGQKTKELVIEYFDEEKILGFADNAADLAELVIEGNRDDEVIFFCGDQRRDELPDLLRTNEIEVNEIVVYQTIAVPKKLDKQYDGILFFSPTAVDSYFRLNKVAKKTVLFAIGNTTANAIKKYSGNKIIISKIPAKENMIKEVINFFDE